MVARAYIYLLNRYDALDTTLASDIGAALDRAGKHMASGERDRSLSRELKRLAKALKRDDAQGAVAQRLDALAGTLNDIAKRVG